MISYNNSAPKAVNNVGQFGATEGSIGAYKSAAEYAADAKYWALLSQTKYSSVEEILVEVERLYAQGRLLEEDIKQLKNDFESQEQVLLGLIQSTGTAIDNTNAATELSKEATQNVLAQLDIISNMSVQTTLLPPGSLATGSYDNTTGVFSFGIPEGKPGRDGTDGTISDIGSVPVGTPVVDDYGFYVDKDDGGLYRADMSDIANLIPSVRSVSINGGTEQTGSVVFDSVSTFNGRKGAVVAESGDYTAAQVGAFSVSNNLSEITNTSAAITNIGLADYGIGSSTLNAITSFDWQTFVFTNSARYYVRSSNMINAPAELIYISDTGLFIEVIGAVGTSAEVRVVPFTGDNSSYVTYAVRSSGAAGSRTFVVRKVLSSAIPVTISQGGTGATSAASARTNLGLGLVATESIVPITKGGTGSTSAENARLALVAAKSGDNYDITSLNNLTTPLSLIQGGTGATTAADAVRNLGISGSSGDSLVGGDLSSYGADNTGVTPCDDHLDQMIADGKFYVKSGTYLITRTHTINIGSLNTVYVEPNVEFLLKVNTDGFVFKNPIADFNSNGMRITVDIAGGGYSGVALTLRGGTYYTSPANFGRLSQRTKFGPFYVFNKQGAIKQEAATSAINDEGYGFSIDCNSSDQEILIWNDVDVSSTGFTNAHAIGVGTNPLNFISSLDLNLVAWFSTNHFVDNSVPVSGGNVAGGIGDIIIRLKSQSHAQMQKVVKIANGIGFMGGCHFHMSMWDPNVFGYRAGVVDALTGNVYTNTLERLAYPLTRMLNFIDASAFPVSSYRSDIQKSDILLSSNSELAKYLYLSTVTSGMSVPQACNAIKSWCSSNGVRNDFRFELFLGGTSGVVREVFSPWINAIGDDSGHFSLEATCYSGEVNSIKVTYKVDPIVAGGKTEVHEILWTSSSGLVSHRLIEYTFGSTTEIRSKRALQVKGFQTFDTTFNIPVWYDGDSSWLKADGAVAYGL